MNLSISAAPEKRLWKRTWDTLVDANPVVAKELLVTARTPAFVGTVIVAPLALGALVLLVRTAMGQKLDSIAGPQLFSVYFSGLLIALGIFGAALGSTVVVQEREAGTLEALKFSALSPRRIVLGKFAAVVLAEAALVICTLPFLVIVLSAGGVSLVETAIAMTIALAFGMMTASIGVAVSACASNTRRSLLGSLLGSGLIAIGLSLWLALGSELVGLKGGDGPFAVAHGYFEAPYSGRSVAILFLVPVYALVSVLWLGYAVGTSGLMDLSEGRARPIQGWMMGAYAIGMITLALCCHAAGVVPARDLMAGASMTAAAILAGILLFVFVGEPVRPMRRMQAQSRSPLDRVLYPRGLAPSVFHAVVVGAIVLVSIPMLSGASAPSEPQALWAVAFLSVLGASMGSVAAHRGPTFARRLGALALASFILLFAVLRHGARSPSWADVLCPLWPDPEYGVRVERVLGLSVVAWGAAALASFAVLLRVARARADQSSRLV